MIKMRKSRISLFHLLLICSFLLLPISSLKNFSFAAKIDSYSISHNISIEEDSGKNKLGLDLKVSSDLNIKNSLDLKLPSDLNARNGYAIIAGISNYPGTANDLSYCDDDARDIYSMLINDYNFKAENIILLQDSAATKNAISSAFDTITAQITPDDVFFFYYSGHGGEGQVSGPYSNSINSPHPYSNNVDLYWDITHPNAAYMRVHFTQISVEYGYDFIFIGDSDLHSYPWPYYQEFTGSYSDVWSGWIPLLSDNTLTVNLYTDDSNIAWGFAIDQYEIITIDGTHYLCSYDSIPSTPSNYYLDSLLDSKLDAMNCDQKFVILDSCHSGGFIPETQSADRYIISACQDDEFSLEDSERQNGCFTYNFLRSIDLATDSNGDGAISMEEQYDYSYSTTVSRSSDLGYTHHPHEYDGISGQAILETNFASVSFSTVGNQLNYYFQLSGVGQILNLTLMMCELNATDIVYKEVDLTDYAISNTGFEIYSGSENLGNSNNITSYGINARIQGTSIIELENLHINDYDGDTIDDLTELNNQLDPRMNDTDSDGLDDAIEFHGETDPLINDTDGDGLSDGDEILIYHTSGTNADTDSDGLEDGFEIQITFTNPLQSDTDADEMSDGYEYDNDLNYTVNDAIDDYDGDGLMNIIEFDIGTEANNNDTDGDGMSDGYEFYNYLDYMINDANDDYDGDGLMNIIEFDIGTEANNNDTDGDGMYDGYEYYNGLDYTIDDALLDNDNDGLSNYMEFLYNSNPQDSDTDNDGLLDGNEVNIYHTNVLNPDTDGDGFSDGMEIEWGVDPNNPRSSVTTVILNYSGIVVLGVVGISSGKVYFSYKKYKKSNVKTKFKKNFKIQSNIEKFNALRKEKVEISYQRYHPAYSYLQKPSIGNSNLTKTKTDLINFLTNRLPVPHSIYTPEGKKAIIVANMALESIKKGGLMVSIDLMTKALLMGVPEPYNTQIKNVLINTIKEVGDQPLKTNNVGITQKCMKCGQVNGNEYKFCVKCGEKILSESDQGAVEPKTEYSGMKFCKDCGSKNEQDNLFCVQCGRGF